jgi:uncharacterized protein (TIGR02996 family)
MSDAERSFAALFPDPQERDLLLGICAHPEDADRRRVYADWLEERGGALSAARAAYLRGTGPAPRRYAAEWLSALGETRDGFRDLQQQVAAEGADGGWEDSLKVECNHGLLDFHYSGDATSDQFGELQQRLVGARVAPVLHSFRIDPCPERGFANGTLTFGLDWLSGAQAEFPRFTSLVLTPLGGFVLSDYSEGGANGRLLRKCPALKHLTTPSAPDETFFQGGPFALESLRVAAGYDHEGFLRRLSGSAARFPRLRALDFADYSETYMDDWQAMTTPAADYDALFRSPLMGQLERVTLREVALSPEEVAGLLAIRSAGVTIERSQEA